MTDLSAFTTWITSYKHLQGQHDQATHGRGDGENEFSATVYHGSPNKDLGTVLSSPGSRQYDNATSVFGAFFATTPEAAGHYAGDSGKIYQTKLTLHNPERMSWGEFQYFQDITKDENRRSLPPDRWKDRMQELIGEARQLKKELLDDGKDGIIITNRSGDIVEIASFNDVDL